jgi:hypothetical protein
MADYWIERYLRWLEGEIDRLGGGAIARHYLKCAKANYREFCASRDSRARFSAWLAIRTACQWLSQLRRTSS